MFTATKKLFQSLSSFILKLWCLLSYLFNVEILTVQNTTTTTTTRLLLLLLFRVFFKYKGQRSEIAAAGFTRALLVCQLTASEI